MVSKFIWLKLEFKIKSYKRKQKKINRKEQKKKSEPASPIHLAGLAEIAHWAQAQPTPGQV